METLDQHQRHERAMTAKSRFLIFTSFIFACWLLATLAVSGQEKKDADPKKTEEKKKPEYKAPPLKPITDKLPAVFGKPAPESVEDLKAIEKHVADIVEKVSPAVVSVRVGASSGSGVIVSKDGYVLTAGHVSGTVNRDVTIYFHSGKTAKGKTLGGNHGIDSGLIKITTEGDWPCVDMGDSANMEKGAWCMVIAHHGGFKPGRTPPVRLGRILNNDLKKSTLTTDAVLVGGDSGGPLFDMHGRVVGINSRIGNSLTANMHVPVNPFRDEWAKIAGGETWGKLGGGKGGFGKGGGPLYLGFQTDPMAEGCVVLSIVAGGPAEKAGIKVKDVIKKVDDTEITNRFMLGKLVNAKKAGETVTLQILRGDEKLSLKVEISKRP
jgi:serine protease Do